MRTLIFVTHPEVIVAPTVDVRRWKLSAAGRRRIEAFSVTSVVSDVAAIWSSAETKAAEAAEILGAHLGIAPRVDVGLGENDRSSTGFLEPEEFERMACAFFAHPGARIRGWERAIDAQRRILDAVERVLAHPSAGDVAIVSHGAVGALLMCHCAGRPISRNYDQPSQGHFWVASIPELKVWHGWRSIADGTA